MFQQRRILLCRTCWHDRRGERVILKIAVLLLSQQLSFETDIKPMFRQKCAHCHTKTFKTGSWLDYNNVVKNKDKIYNRVVIKKDMPRGGVMTPEQRELVKRWIEEGTAP